MISRVVILGAARSFAELLRQGLAAPRGVLGGGFPGYWLYRTREGHVALAALEPHFFWERLLQELGVNGDERRDLERIFETETAEHREDWGTARDLPLAAVRDIERDEQDEEDENAFVLESRQPSGRGEDKP